MIDGKIAWRERIQITLERHFKKKPCVGKKRSRKKNHSNKTDQTRCLNLMFSYFLAYNSFRFVWSLYSFSCKQRICCGCWAKYDGATTTATTKSVLEVHGNIMNGVFQLPLPMCLENIMNKSRFEATKYICKWTQETSWVTTITATANQNYIESLINRMPLKYCVIITL